MVTKHKQTIFALRILFILFMLYLFLTAIELFGVSIKILGKETAALLFSGLSNPFAGLFVGILSTVIVQSSSVTTSMIVAMVGSGELPLQFAVPIVMGANIGTSVTNTLVSLGNIGRRAQFKRAFAGATVHDFFNLLGVLVFFPLEIFTHFLEHSAVVLANFLPVSGENTTFSNPIKNMVAWSGSIISHFFSKTFGLSGKVLAGFLALLAFFLIVVSLLSICKNMRIIIASRAENWLNKVFSKQPIIGLLAGIFITVSVQSSSITTSLLIPLYASGILSLEAGFSITVGANIGTTITAILASTVTGPAGLSIAFVHLLFNFCGTVLFWLSPLKALPLFLSQRLALWAVLNKLWVIIYILVVFFIIPIIGILIF